MGRMQLRANARDSGISTLLISSHCRKAGRQPDAFRRRPERKGNQTAQGGQKWEVKVVRGYLTLISKDSALRIQSTLHLHNVV